MASVICLGIQFTWITHLTGVFLNLSLCLATSLSFLLSLFPHTPSLPYPLPIFSLSLLSSSNSLVPTLRLLCSHLLLNPWFTGFVLRRRLRAKALDLFYLDQALDTLGQGQLTDTEIREACYLWRLNPSSLTTSQCREWLLQWLQLSTHLTESETSLLLHNMVLLSMTTPAPDQRKKACSCNQTIC
ncbi:LETM1 domain-containing protein 1-like [Coregonus clupeaformis]|uniref:LETM1 domain-containing protein 1-like n=1 Tax=Coregonus clupeaformis TaxID=59861 RepID=UPI001BE0B59D|nr:LETM1 domain-containing protein 1-like [Coregonus clupeaformis]